MSIPSPWTPPALASRALEAALTSELTVLGVLCLAIGVVLLTGLQRRSRTPRDSPDRLHPAWPAGFLGGGVVLVVAAVVVHGAIG